MTFPERWVKEFDISKPFHLKIHIIKGLNYRQAISWDGFFSYKHERNHIESHKHFFKDYRQIDFEFDERFSNLSKIDVTCEWIQHEDLYAFYNYIGYDRKSKKFKR